MALLCAAVSLFAQALPEHQFAAGRWSFIGSRLYQSDKTAGLAKMNIRVPQNGPMIYEFNVRYEDGIQDGHGGFGIHVFEDAAFNGRSWGAGRSWLLWLNYDEHPVANSGIPYGFSAQVYQSRSNSLMDLKQSYDLNMYVPYITWNDITSIVPVKIYINGDTGEVRVYDPTDPQLSAYWYFFIDKGLRGDWISIRTNGASVSFGAGPNTFAPNTTAPVAASTPASAPASAPATTNWRSVIDEYEKYVDDAISAMNRARTGDLTAAATAVSLQQRAQPLAERLEQAVRQNQLSTAEYNRFIAISARAANAAASAAGLR